MYTDEVLLYESDPLSEKLLSLKRLSKQKVKSLGKEAQVLKENKVWSKVNAKSQSQLVQGQSQRILVQVRSRFPSRVTAQVVELLTSSYDVSLTWTRADVDVLAWLLTWSDDVR